MSESAAPVVLNFYAEGRTVPPGAVYIGRSRGGGSGQWGNPFSIGADGSREDVIEKYRQHLLADPELMARARRDLRDKNLVCFCAPRACHGDVLLQIANAPE